MLEAKLDGHLGYDNKNKNTRNRYRNKNVKSDFGEITLNILRDLNGDFEPEVIRNYENDISEIENQVIGIYSKVMSTQDISRHLKSIYGIDISHTLIAKATDKVILLAHE